MVKSRLDAGIGDWRYVMLVVEFASVVWRYDFSVISQSPLICLVPYYDRLRYSALVPASRQQKRLQ